MSLREYNRLKKQYRKRHGTNPPKGTKLPKLRSLLGAPATSSATVTHSRSVTVPVSSSDVDDFWQPNYGRGGWR